MGYEHKDYEEWNDFEDILNSLDEIIKSGKVKYIGLSKESAWGLTKFLEISKTKNLSRIMSVQNPYNLLNRTYEVGLAEMSHREDVGLLAYSPLGFGMLTGKYEKSAPQNSRLGLYGDWFTRYSNDMCKKATSEYVKVAKKFNISPTHLALAFVNTRAFLTSNIIGATTMKQLKEDIESINIKLSSEIIDEINLVHKNNPNPAP